MLILPMLIAIMTGLCSAALVLMAGHGVLWAFLAYSGMGGVGLVLASMVYVASGAHMRGPPRERPG